MDSGDEAFSQFIEVDHNGLSNSEVFEETDNKENSAQSESVLVKSKPTKKAQIEKIIVFVKENNEQLIEKSAYDLMWNSLTDDLNRLGPPEYSSDKWKRVWSQYKYRNKTQLTELFRCQGQNEPSQSAKRRKLSDQSPVQTENSFSSQMAKVLEKQDNMMNIILEQGEIIKRSAQLLEELSKKIK